MAKTFSIRLEVEKIALGPVLDKLNEMPGIAKLDLDLGRGGEGAGRERLESAVPGPRGANAEKLVKLLLDGPKHVTEIAAIIGGKKTFHHQLISKLSKAGLLEKSGDRGVWQLTAKARVQLGTLKALPPPSKVSQGPKGRASPGSGNIVLKQILIEGPKSTSEIRVSATGLGMSEKSIAGVIDRAKRNKLIKKNGHGYVLTAKGRKIETGAPADG